MQDFITHLPNLGVISVTGPQQAEYLQGQLTINMNTLSNDTARLGGHCDFKGKLWSIFHAIKNEQGVLLSMHVQSLEKSIAELKKYGVFSKVEIDDVSSQFACYGAHGNEAGKIVNTLFKDINKQHLSVTQNEFGYALYFNDCSERFLLLLTESGQARLHDITGDDLQADSSAFEILEIEAGMANIQSGTVNEFVPQMLNLQALAAIDFDKGCYMGQETVARTKFLGRNKRAAYILLSTQNVNADELAAGSSLEKQAGENWRSGGVIMRSASVEGKTKILATLANDTQAGDMLRLKSNPEVVFETLALPYSLDEK